MRPTRSFFPFTEFKRNRHYSDARIHTEKRQAYPQRVGCDLKGQRSKWRFIACWTCIFRFIFFEYHESLHFIWRRQVINHGIQHGLDTFVLESSTTQQRDDFTSQCALTQTALRFPSAELTFFEVACPSTLRSASAAASTMTSRMTHLIRDSAGFLIGEGHSHIRFVPGDEFRFIRSTTPLNLLRANRHLDRHGVQPKRSRTVHHPLKVGTSAVHLVDETHPRTLHTYWLDARRFLSAAAHLRATKTTTAPSSTRRERSTSIVKSTCPGYQ